MAEKFRLLDFAYAHRGLWSPDGPAENSLEAFEAAARAGLGCELDVRPAACGTPVVFHDKELDRMTDETGLVADHPASELTKLPLKGGGTLPTLAQLLEAWPGEAPLLIEIKIDGLTDAEGFTELVAEQVAAHDGPAALLSFSRRAVNAIPDGVMKGALVLPSDTSEDVTLQALVSTAAGLRPDFLACNLKDAREATTLATDYGLPLAIWTVKSAAEADEIGALPVAQIFEGFDPAFARPR